jgi:hypothetical protein
VCGIAALRRRSFGAAAVSSDGAGRGSDHAGELTVELLELRNVHPEPLDDGGGNPQGSSPQRLPLTRQPHRESSLVSGVALTS